MRNSTDLVEIELHPLPSSHQEEEIYKPDLFAPDAAPTPSLDSKVPFPGPGDVEMTDGGGVKVSKRQEMVYMSAACFAVGIAGWIDGSSGPLIPSLQEHYAIGYLTISLIFICGFCGFLGGAILNVWLSDRLGFGKTVAVGAAIQCLSFALSCWAPPFPLFAITFVINGVGTSLMDAQCNTIVNRFPSSDLKMQFLHAGYGLGATASPFIATLFVQYHPTRFYFHYLVTLSLCIVELVCVVAVFRFKTSDQLLGEAKWAGDMGMAKKREGTAGERAEGERGVEGVVRDVEQGSGRKLLSILKIPRVHLIAFFLLFYVGLEVTIGGWIVSYIIDVRGGDSNAGYVSSGFFGGLMLGRLVLIPVNRWLGNIWSIYVYLAVCLGFEFLVWFVPGVIGPSVAVSFVGLFLGPIYPIIMNVIGLVFPPSTVAAVIGWCASVGASGAAFVPFVTGAMAQKLGVKVLQPITVFLLAGNIVFWALVPKKAPTKRD